MYCECGCGQITKINTRNDKRQGLIKGQHKRCVKGHSPLKSLINYKGVDKWVESNQKKHLCSCGCGGYIKIISSHFNKGIPRYIHGHHANTPEMKKIYRENNTKRVGELSPRWKENRNEVRGRIRCKVDFTKRQKRDIYIRDEGICQYCGIICLLDVDIDHPHKVNIDHIIPVEEGGTNDISNGQVLCLSCHKEKHSAKAKRVNSRDARTVNLEPSQVESWTVQRLLEDSTLSLITSESARLEREEIVQPR